MKLSGGGYAGHKTIKRIRLLHREIFHPNQLHRIRDDLRITVRFDSVRKKKLVDLLSPQEKAIALISAAKKKRARQ